MKSQEAKKTVSTGPVLRVNVEGPVAVKTLLRESARSRTIVLAQKYDGRPLAEFKAAWEKAAKAGQIHHDTSVFPTGKSKSKQPHQSFSGWYSWLARNGICTAE